MKGGRTAPRDLQFSECSHSLRATSMKGGRTAPRDQPLAAKPNLSPCYFNEGGADCPPRLGEAGI